MNDARHKEIQRALELIREAKGVQEQVDFDQMSEDVQDNEEGLRARDAIDALERAVTCCDDAISACEEAISG